MANSSATFVEVYGSFDEIKSIMSGVVAIAFYPTAVLKAAL